MQYGWDVDFVIYLDSDEDILLDRITGRRVCPKCGETYHVNNHKPDEAGICNICQTKLVQRPDDTIEITKRRLVIYHEQTQPIIDFYEARNNFVCVDGDGSIAEVTARVIKRLEGKK